MTSYGGYNGCIAGSNGPPSVLPNCTGYVHGRVMEIAGVNTDNLGLSFNDAYTYYTNSSSDWVQSSEPSLGAVICYYSLPNWSSFAPYPGHVAIVEQIIDSDTIVCSQSDYGGNRFTTYTLYRSYNWCPYPYPQYGVDFLGFLINPHVTPTPPPPVPAGSTGLLKKWYTCNNISGTIRKRRY